MAPVSAFKVKCPSCEAMVTIRDPKLIGKKIDCPKCKFRFAVEAPPEPTDDSPADADKPKAKSGKEAPAKSKNKPLPKRDDDEQDAATGKKKNKNKKSDSNKTLYIGGGIGVLAILVLGGAYFAGLFDGDDVPKGGNPPPAQAKNAPPKVDPKIDPKTNTSKKDPPKDTPIDIVKDDITNLLPENSIWVFKINGRELLDTPVGAVFFEESGDSARAFRRWMGFGGEDVERFVCSGAADGTFFGVFRLKKDFGINDLKDAMEIDPTPKTINKRELYSIKSNELMTMMADYLASRMTSLEINWPKSTGNRALALCFTDPRTLVLADQPALDKLLVANLQRRPQTTYVPPDAPTPKAKKEETPEEKKKERPSFTSNPSFLTVDPALKIMMYQLEQDKSSIASFAIKMADGNKTMGGFLRNQGVGFGLDRILLPASPTVGLVVRKVEAEKLNIAAAIEFPTANEAVALAQGLQPVAAQIARKLTLMFRVPVGIGSLDPNIPPMPPPPVGQRNVEERLPSPRELGRSDDREDGFQFINFQVGLKEDPKKFEPKGPLTSAVTIVAIDKFLMLTLDVNWGPSYREHISPSLRSSIDLLKGEALMMTGRAHWYTLATTLKGIEKIGVMPLAAYPRTSDQSRFDLPYPPEQRVSWMVELLPFMGYEGLSRRVRRDEAWNSDANLLAGSAWVPEFLSNEFPEPTWRAFVPSLKGMDLGATHFIGLTGIGMDSGQFPDTPEYAKKLGLFGYNRQAKLADVSAADGLSNTIYLMQVPPNMPRPWIRGGGATVQGVRLEGSIKPFVSPLKDGRKGTYTLMADGSIRFLSETTNDQIFQGLATYKGGEKIENLDQIAPFVKKGEAVLKTPMN
ncbi:MAG: DUF1559 domain-containing protein [Planctomycetes bacterium]|nr:DUF1559 domain-containing protein [Planctomycetota bacterium]